MGSRNSEHSGSMDSEEFLAFLGHNYSIPAPILQNQLHLQVENESFNSDAVMAEPLSPAAQARMREQIQLILNDGTIQNATGPIDVTSLASNGGSNGGSNEKTSTHVEVNSGTAANTNGNIHKPSVNLHVDVEEGEIPPAAKQTKTWSNVVAQNIINPTASNAMDDEPIINYHEDGSASVEFSQEFLVQAQKKWETSIIGNFVGGNFAFKYVREQAQRIWKNKGLTGVFYSSKGYYTLRFSTMEEKNKALNLNVVQIGGKTMYLRPWMEGSNFKRNVVDKVPCWIRLVDVPFSLWSKHSLSSIARAVGRPLRFDEATARFEPLKYANVQVELSYTSPRPDYVWVNVLNPNGVKEKERVEVQYSQLPYSCSLCEAFGHSLARCINNPNRVNKKQKMAQNGNRDGASTSTAEPLSPTKSEYLNNMEMVPYKIGEFCGCDVVMDTDDVLKELEKNDNLDEFDRFPMLMGTHEAPGKNHENTVNAMPLASVNGFEILSEFAEDQIDDTIKMSDNKRKKGVAFSQDSPQTDKKALSLVVDLRVQTKPTIPRPPNKKDKSVVESDGFKQVSYKRSPRLAGLSTPSKRIQ